NNLCCLLRHGASSFDFADLQRSFVFVGSWRKANRDVVFPIPAYLHFPIAEVVDAPAGSWASPVLPGERDWILVLIAEVDSWRQEVARLGHLGEPGVVLLAHGPDDFRMIFR